MTDPAELGATAASFLRARGDEEAADLLERARLELAGEPQRWSVEGRLVRARRVAIWLDPADRVLVARSPELHGALREAVAAAIEAPDETLRELLVFCRRVPGAALEPGYRGSAAPAGLPDGSTLAATAAAYLDATGARPIAEALRRGEVAVEPVPGGVATHLCVRLDPADLASLRRDPDKEASLREALEAAALGPSHRAASISLGLLGAEDDARPEGPEERLCSSARRAGWPIIAVDRDSGGATLALVAAGRLHLVRIETASGAWRAEVEKVAKVTVPAADLSDDDAALRALTRIASG